MTLKEFWKSASIWWSYAYNTIGSFFPDMVYNNHVVACFPECVCERIFKICQYLAKIWTKVWWHLFLDSLCILCSSTWSSHWLNSVRVHYRSVNITSRSSPVDHQHRHHHSLCEAHIGLMSDKDSLVTIVIIRGAPDRDPDPAGYPVNLVNWTVSEVGSGKYWPDLHCVQKKTPTHVFFYISVENV